MTSRLASRWNSAWRDQAGVSAVEFALILPLMLMIFFAGYVVADAITIRRKVAITSRTVADLTTQVSSLTTSQMSTILSSASAVLAPYSTSSLSIRLSEITVNAAGTLANVTWSTASNTTPLTCSAAVTIPSTMLQSNAVYILSQVSYNFVPAVGSNITKITGNLTLSDTLYMVPRISASVSYPCPD